MLNIDGVIFGNFRTGLVGKDLNRCFKEHDDLNLYPEIKYVIELASDLKKTFNDNMIGFYDFHGHSQKRNVFCYGPQY